MLNLVRSLDQRLPFIVLLAFSLFSVSGIYGGDGSTVPVCQIASASVTLAFLLFKREFTLYTKHSLLDFTVALTLAWVISSFVANSLLDISAVENYAPRLRSLIVTLFYFCTYYLFKNLMKSERHVLLFLKCLLFSGIIFLFFKSGEVIESYNTNIRSAFGQRQPLQILLILSLSYLFLTLLKRMRKISFLTFGIAATFICISLTRSALITMVFMFIWFYSNLSRSMKFKTLISFALLVPIFVNLNQTFNWIHWQRYLMRPEFLGGSGDESGSVRLVIWSNIADAVMTSTWNLLTGFGELGASFIAKPFVYAGEKWSNYSAHSEYMDVFIRRGSIGLMLFGLQFFVILKTLVLCDKDSDLGSVTRVISLFLLSTYIYGLFNETIRYTPFGIIFFSLLGLLSAIEKINSPKASEILDAENAKSQLSEINLKSAIG